MGRRNPVLDGGPEVLRDVAMTANFGTQFCCITGFVGNNFGCMEDIADFGLLRDVVMATIFGFLHMGAHWRRLANTTEPSMCGGDAALCQITLITCCLMSYLLCQVFFVI